MLDILPSATSAGESASLLIISVALVAFLAAGIKVRTLRSFQTEMLVFALVLFAAEVPRILGTLGVIDVSAYQDFGLEVHSASMVVLAVFVAYRVYGFRRPSQKLLAPMGGDEAIAEAIRSILSEKIGDSAAKAVQFYFDSRIASFDPGGYSRMLQKTFLGGAQPLVAMLVSELCTQFGLEHREGMDLSECVKEIRAKAKGSTP